VADPDIDALAREAIRERRLPDNASCATCGVRSHLSHAPDGRVLCYGHRRDEAGAGPTEADHLAGRRNLGGVTVPLRANDHREVTELRLRVGLDEWPDAEGDPVRQLGHLLAGLGTLLLLLGRWLMELAEHLTARLGHGWWTLAPGMPVSP
jgi:hypothetical protein